MSSSILLTKEESLEAAFEVVRKVKDLIASELIGQDELVSRLLCALIAKEHILLEGLPGLGKTLSIKALSNIFSAKFSRIQFTPDLLPSDIIGSEIFRPENSSFEFRPGPVFTNFLLADEINRAPAKVQSALLETMQEKQVTVGNKSYKIEEPFLVLATQNPIEQEGTYNLPEAQVDRFMLKVKVGYPTKDEEMKILSLVEKRERNDLEKNKDLRSLSLEDIKRLNIAFENVYVSNEVRNYILDVVASTRESIKSAETENLIEVGASPRASISLLKATKAFALLEQKSFVTPEMVKKLAKDVLRHRIILSFEAEADQISQDDVIDIILNKVVVP